MLFRSELPEEETPTPEEETPTPEEETPTPEETVSTDNTQTILNNRNKIISPVANIITLVIFTVIFYAVCFFVPKLVPMATLFYFLLLFLMQLLVNIKNTEYNCGSIKGSPSLIWGFIPIFLIIGPVFLAIELLPGLNKPFSNTFGYAISLMMGVKKRFRALMPILNEETNESMPLVNEIYNNPSLLINEMTPKNFTYIISRLSQSHSKTKVKNPTFPKKILRPEITKEVINEFEEKYNSNSEYHKMLKSLLDVVRIKEMVGKFIWILLAGILACTLAYNKILATDCSISSSDSDGIANTIVEASETSPLDTCQTLTDKDSCVNNTECSWADGENGENGICSKIVENASEV